MIGILYDVIVTPLIYLIELVYSIMGRLFSNPGISIIGVSLAVNFLTLPLYRRADQIQEQERQKQASMAHWVDHIKKHFKGDEQYMMLSTYYRQQNYNQLSMLSGSLSLLFQIPFFMAAYNYLSSLELLKGASFLCFSDLGSPDQLISIAGFSINVLPVLMTLLNVVSTFVYTKGLALRDKIQAYGLALVFLILLYQSPSGLVLYWTFNQVFSLLKNIFIKVLANPRKDFTLLTQLVLFAACSFLILAGKLYTTKRIVAVIVMVSLIELAVFWPAIHEKLLPHRESNDGGDVSSHALFVLAGSVITVLLGVVIPSALIADSPTEFINEYNFVNPLHYVVRNTCVIGGFTLVWAGAYYFLFPEKGKRIISMTFAVLSCVFVADYFFFGDNLGIINTSLVFDNSPSYTFAEIVVNCAIVTATAAIVLALAKKKGSALSSALGIALIALIGLSVPNIATISRAAGEAEARIVQNDSINQDSEYDSTLFDTNGNVLPLFSLSRHGKNVVILFLDRAISGYLPYIINERPELEAAFDGFVYYPNTVSFGQATVLASPSLYGGLDYTPLRMNARSDELNPEKHNEALSVLPTLFSEMGYQVTLTDPPFLDYKVNSPDYSALDGIPNLNVYTLSNAYTNTYKNDFSDAASQNVERNFVFYSLFKASPLVIQPLIYDNGVYYSTISNHAVNGYFMAWYTVLTNLSNLTRIDDGSSNNFLFMQNSATHEPDLLSLPDYEPTLFVDYTAIHDYSRFTLNGRTMEMGNGENQQVEHYHINMATMIQLASWFDYLREQGVYDNTRIIIVADHGRGLGQFDDLIIDGVADAEWINPLFMVKDFDAHGFTVSDELMTNADTPAFALEGLADHPVNPYTGNPIIYSYQDATDPEVTFSYLWNPVGYEDKTTLDIDDGYRFTVHGALTDPGSWTMTYDPTQSGD